MDTLTHLDDNKAATLKLCRRDTDISPEREGGLIALIFGAFVGAATVGFIWWLCR